MTHGGQSCRPESVHLILTSPPYWTLKEYRRTPGQLGWIADYDDEFLDQLDGAWRVCHRALVPARTTDLCVVGDVCLSRRKNSGRHTVVPLHASIQDRCRGLGFDNLAPIIWHKIANVAHEVQRGSAGFLGKPYEPNAVIKNDIEFILMQRKPGGYRRPSIAARTLSLLSETSFKTYFRQIWTDIAGASTRHHPAPYPVALADRLIRMFSFVGDTVLDPFTGTASTQIAAAACGRNSIGVEVDPAVPRGKQRNGWRAEASSLFRTVEVRTGELDATSGRTRSSGDLPASSPGRFGGDVPRQRRHEGPEPCHFRMASVLSCLNG